MQLWQKLSEQIVYDGYRKVARREYRLPNGEIHSYDIVLDGRVCCCLALTENNEVILAKQFRPGQDALLMELPGGGVDLNETPEEAMRRELLEETGYEGELEAMGTTNLSAYSTCRKWNFLARNCKKVSEQALEDRGRVEVVLLPLQDFREHLLSGDLTDADTGWLGLEKLREKS